MARAKRIELDNRFSITPEERAAVRAEMEKEMERARREGVYERLLEWVGKVEWPDSVREAREEDD